MIGTRFGSRLRRRATEQEDGLLVEEPGDRHGGGLDRRNMLRLGGMAACGAAGVVIATAAATPPAWAGTDGDVVLNADNFGSGRTSIIEDFANNEVFGGFNGPASGAASPAAGLRGRAAYDAGHFATYASETAIGVYGEAHDPAQRVKAVGVWGDVLEGTGVLGSATTGNGVEGASGSSIGVAGSSVSGTAVEADTSTGTALSALTIDPTNTNPAVKALSSGKGQAVFAGNTGAATTPTVQAISAASVPAVKATGKAIAANGATVPLAGNGAALTVQGIASFTRSGVKTLSAAASSVTVQVPGGLTAASHVLATLQTHTGTVAVQAAVPNASNGTVIIYFNAIAPIGTKVAWFVFG
jgi:hypothetical protein